MIEATFKAIRTPLKALGVFFFSKEHKKIIKKHKKMTKTVDKGINKVYNIIIK